jgi:methylmalonyl-CoA mutase N-terminal domain/subunit
VDRPGTESWQDAYERAPKRDATFTTMSGVPLEPVYGPEGAEAELPGQWPYTRGPYASMYRSRLWTMRQFAGFGTAADTNARFKELLRSGGSGLSTAFDMPTLLGRDSDDPLAKGEVGRAGVAIDTQVDMETLFAGIPLGSVSTSMTINSAAAVVMAMYIGVADATGVERRDLSGTIQNDILKEYQAQKEYVFPPRPSVRLVSDLIREAGSTALQELAFTLANGFAYVEAATRAGLAVDEFAPRLSFFFNAHIDFFEEIAKYRAARRLWATWMRDHYGAEDPRSVQLRFHTQTAGVSLTAQQAEVNLARVAIEALAGVLGGTQSLHTDAYDEALALPTDHAARLALRTQQVIAEETGVAHVADPLGGSWLVESLTDELCRRSEEIFAYLLERGSGSMLEGAIESIEDGWFCREIADAAYEFQSKVASRRWIQVGVNGYTDGDVKVPSTLYIDPQVEATQLRSLAEVKQDRDDDAVRASLVRIGEEAADPARNLMPALIEAAARRVTVGEAMGAMEDVFGTWLEQSFV